MSDANRQLIESFYRAFQARDHAAMAGCYHTEVHFSDPVFGDLHGSEARAMWHMLCEQGKDLVLEFSGVEVGETGGQAHWEARYTFGATGRKVHNIIEASFQFRDGKIGRHADTFDLWRWTRMALGPTGLLLGWSPMVQNRVRTTARRGLDAFIEAHPEYR